MIIRNYPVAKKKPKPRLRGCQCEHHCALRAGDPLPEDSQCANQTIQSE
jgi:hypothetical protein